MNLYTATAPTYATMLAYLYYSHEGGDLNYLQNIAHDVSLLSVCHSLSVITRISTIITAGSLLYVKARY